MKNIITTICKNEIYYNRFINQKHSPVFNTFTLYEYISQKLGNYYLLTPETSKTIINKFEEYLTLSKIINSLINENKNNELLDRDSLIKNIQSAFSMIQEYCIDINHSFFQSTAESKLLIKIYSEYSKFIKKNSYLTFHQAIDFFIDHIECDEKIELIGFHQKTPFNLKIRNKFKCELKVKKSKKNWEINEYIDTCNELLKISNEILMHLKNNKNIAIISFDISLIADDLESSLNNPVLKNQVLNNNEKIIINRNQHNSLIKQPLIKALITYFNIINNQTVSLNDLKLLIFVVYNSNIELLSKCDRIFLKLKSSGIKIINYALIIKIIMNDIPEIDLFNSVNLIDTGKKLSLYTWIETIENQFYRSFITKMNIYKDHHRDLRQLETLFASIKKIRNQNELTTFDIFQQHLCSFVDQTQVKNQYHKISIDAYSFTDDIVGYYDHIYLVNFIDRNDFLEHHNYLLPYQFLRQINSTSLKKEFSQQQLNAFNLSTSNFHISYALSADDIENSPNMLIKFSKFNQIQFMEDYDYLGKNITKAIENNNILPIQPHKISNFRGLLERMQKSPRWSFFYDVIQCSKELNISPEEQNTINRGILIHLILNKFWSEINSQDELCAIKMLGQYVEKLVLDCINNDVRFSRLKKSIKQFEIKRCTTLILKILEIEKSRNPFKIKSSESKQTYNLQSFSFDLIRDREDLEGEILHIVDYKTGKHNSHNSWLKSPFENFQFPLYLLFSESDRMTLMIYEINIKETQIRQFVFAESNIAKINPTDFIQITDTKMQLKELKKSWLTEISHHLNLYQQGYFPNLFNDESELLFCNCKVLLRIPEKNFQFES
ncbi:MAG: PD-(D/E)XK nuclease family protein [Proteobacteria bacterium]|nr:PD-(D/E)XK nuclease family protein [Pseudomonadota bacterium]